MDVDLEFSTPDGVPEKARPTPSKTAQSPPAKITPLQKSTPVTNISDARQAKVSASPVARPASVGQKIPPTTSTSAVALSENHYSLEEQQVIDLQDQMRKVEFEADVRVAIAEFKTEFLSELLSDMKLMQHQVEQLLVRINSKHPDMKQEVLLIKKILADFTTKKRK